MSQPRNRRNDEQQQLYDQEIADYARRFPKQPAAPPHPADTPAPRGAFKARYAGTCSICSNAITIGARVQRTEAGKVSHAGCTARRSSTTAKSQLLNGPKRAKIIDVSGNYPDTYWERPA